MYIPSLIRGWMVSVAALVSASLAWVILGMLSTSMLLAGLLIGGYLAYDRAKNPLLQGLVAAIINSGTVVILGVMTFGLLIGDIELTALVFLSSSPLLAGASASGTAVGWLVSRRRASHARSRLSSL